MKNVYGITTFILTKEGEPILHIALCDDIANIVDSLRSYLNSYCEYNHIKPKFHCFDSGEAFLSSQLEFDIVFMDIYLKGIKGTEVVRQYRKAQTSQIIFITTSLEHAIEAFGLNATHYLVKPLTQKAVTEAMDRCLTSMELQMRLNKTIEVKSTKGMVSIPTNHIIYIEVFNRTSIIHTKVEHVQVQCSLEVLFDMLDKSLFMRAQRSYIVNMRCIEEVSNDRIFLPGNIEIMLSRKNRKDLKKQYQQFLYSLVREGKL